MNTYFTPLTDWLRGSSSKYIGVYDDDDKLLEWLPRGANTRPTMKVSYNTTGDVASLTLDFGSGRTHALSGIPGDELTNVLSRLNTLL